MSDSATFQPSGRAVRCANCGHGWHQDPPVDYSLRALPHITDGANRDEQRAMEAARASRRVLAFGQVAGWVSLVTCIAVIVAAGYSFRVEMVRLWPQTATLYAALGMPVNTRGVVFEHTDFELDLVDGSPVLSVKGNIVNETDRIKTLPNIKFSLFGRGQRELYHWTIEPPSSELDAFESRQFSTMLDNPPSGAEDLVVTFVRSVN